MKKNPITTANIIWSLLLFLVVTAAGAQQYSDKEIGFDRKQIILEGRIDLKGGALEKFLAEKREQYELRYKLGFDGWLKYQRSLRKKKTDTVARSGRPLDRFVGCEQFTFNSSSNPFMDWTLSHNVAPFSYTDPIDEASFMVPGAGTEFVPDASFPGTFRFKVYPPGSSFVDPYLAPPTAEFASGNFVRVGTSDDAYRKEMISRSFAVNNPTDFIYYNYAIVLEDPGHEGRPYYSIRLLVNDVLVTCSEVKYEAKATITGFEPINGTDVKVKTWASNIIKPIDFGAQLGDTVTIEVEVSDCDAGAHFGYGYFDIRCLSEDEIMVIDGMDPEPCIGQPLSFSTPLNASISNYSWIVEDQNGNNVPVSNPNSAVMTHTFSEPGSYTVKLSIPYFTTTASCTVNSVFTRTIVVTDCNDCIDCTSFDLLKNQKYLVSGWVKKEKPSDPKFQFKEYPDVFIAVTFVDVTQTIIGQEMQFLPSGEIIDGWQRIVGEFTVPGNVDDMHLDLVNADDGSQIAYFDDIRVFPSKGNMKSFVYDKKTQRLMAELDENNYATFYEYDLEGGLVRVKKETEKGVFTIQETRSSNKKAASE